MLIHLFFAFNIDLTAQEQYFQGEWEGVLKTKAGKQIVRLTLLKNPNKNYSGIMFDSNMRDASFCRSAVDIQILNSNPEKILIEGRKILEYKNTKRSIHGLSIMVLKRLNDNTATARIAPEGLYVSLLDSANTLKQQFTMHKVLRSKNIHLRVDNNLMFTNRNIKIYDTIKLKDSIIFIKVYDHGKLDGDSIAIAINNNIINNHLALTLKKDALFYQVPLRNKHNRLSIITISVGKEFPNTTTLEIYDGQKIYIKTMVLESNLNQNAGIDFYIP